MSKFHNMKSGQEIIKQVRALDIIARKNVDDIFSGNFKSAFYGQGLEVDDLRHYEEGDDIKHIDWVATAKEGEAFVKKYKETRETAIIPIIDLSADMNFGSTDVSKRDFTLKLLAILLFSALENSNKMGAVFAGRETEIVPPRKGKKHFLRILDQSLQKYAINNEWRANMDMALKKFYTLTKNHSICFLLSDRLPIKNENLLKIINKKHDFVFIEIYDEFERGKFPNFSLQATSFNGQGAATFDFKNQKARENYLKIIANRLAEEDRILKKNGISFLRLSTKDNIYKELMIFFKARQSKR